LYILNFEYAVLPSAKDGAAQNLTFLPKAALSSWAYREEAGSVRPAISHIRLAYSIKAPYSPIEDNLPLRA
jgi:hypothetical protein